MRQLSFFLLILFAWQIGLPQCDFMILDQDLVPSAAPNFERCNSDGNDNFEVTLFTTDTLTSFSIDWGDLSAPTTTPVPWVVGAPITHTYTTLGTFTITVTNTLGTCAGEAVTGTVVNQRQPRIEFNVKAATITEGCATVDLFTFENTSSNLDSEVTFTWDFGDGNTANSDNLGDMGYPGTDMTHTFDEVGGNCQPAVTLTANFGCGDGEDDVTRDGFITVLETNNPNPNTDIEFLCVNTDITLTDMTVAACGANAPGRFTRWDLTSVGTALPDNHTPAVFNNTQVIQLPDTAEVGDSYVVTLSDSNICGVVTEDITISMVVPPTADLDIIGITNDTLCQSTLYSFDGSGSIGAGTVEYSWSFDGGSNYSAFDNDDDILMQDYASTGMQTVELVVQTQNGELCLDTIIDTLEVIGAPTANYTFITVDNDSCGTREINFTDNSSFGTGTAITSYSWDFDNGDVAVVVNGDTNGVIYPSAATYNPTLTVTNTTIGTVVCTNEYSEPIIVYEIPTVTGNVDTSCFGFPTTFINTTIGTDTYQWRYDTSNTAITSAIPAANNTTTNTYPNTGDFVARLIVNTGACVDSADFDDVFVLDTLEAIFSVDIDEGCDPLTVEFTNTSKGVTNYNWDFDDEGTSSVSSGTFNQIFNNSDSSQKLFPISLIVQAGVCADTLLDTITVYDNPTVAFDVNIPNPPCSPLTIDFSNTTNITTGDTTFQWYFDTGTPNSLNTTDTTTISSVYSNTTFTADRDTVSLVATSPEGCKDSISQSFIIFPEPQVSIDITDTAGCSPFMVEFTPSEPVNSAFWNFGDGNNATVNISGAIPVNNTYIRQASSGSDTTYNVSLNYVSAFTCPGDTTIEITVRRELIAGFEVPVVTPSTTEVTVTDSSQGDLSNITYTYDWGDGSIDTSLSNPLSHTYATYGNQLFSYKVANLHCSDSILNSVITIPVVLPIASFTSDTLSGCGPLRVNFTNQTTPTASDVKYTWSFGGLGTDSTENVDFNFTQTGDYIVVLTAENSAGTTQDFDTIEVIATPTASFIPQPQSVFLPNPITFVNQTILASSYLWDFGDSNQSTDINPSHTYETAGVYDIELIATEGICVDTFFLASAVVVEESSGNVLFGNAFTPNGDGLNDVFIPSEIEGITEYKIQIFNRWGNLVFETTDFTEGWDGTSNGKKSPQGIYIYRAESRLESGKIDIQSGDINLFR